MCVSVLLRDDSTGSTYIIETREQSIYRPHGIMASQLSPTRPSATAYSYGTHWYDDPDTLSNLWTIRPVSRDASATIVGGLDAGGGSWVAANILSGVYCRLFVSAWPDGTLAEANEMSSRDELERAGLVSRSGLPVEVVSLPSAGAAANYINDNLVRALDASSKHMYPFAMLISDAAESCVLTYDGKAIHLDRISSNQPNFVGVDGLNTGSEVCAHILDRVGTAKPPQPGNIASWDEWIDALHPSHEEELAYSESEAWRSHSRSAFQGPYLNTSDNLRHRAASNAPATLSPDYIEWTKSISLVELSQTGVDLFYYNERHLDSGQPIPSNISSMGFPETHRDFRLAFDRTLVPA